MKIELTAEQSKMVQEVQAAFLDVFAVKLAVQAAHDWAMRYGHKWTLTGIESCRASVLEVRSPVKFVESRLALREQNAFRVAGSKEPANGPAKDHGDAEYLFRLRREAEQKRVEERLDPGKVRHLIAGMFEKAEKGGLHDLRTQ